jgi:RNA polymerase-binding transcription factor DksA
MTTHLTPEELQSLRRPLLKKGAELAEILSKLLAGQQVRIDDLIAPRPGETPIEKARRYLETVDKKIKSLAAGTYGSCDQCGAPIPYVYLEQLPWMDTCRTCAARGVG